MGIFSKIDNFFANISHLLLGAPIRFPKFYIELMITSLREDKGSFETKLVHFELLSSNY